MRRKFQGEKREWKKSEKKSSGEGGQNMRKIRNIESKVIRRKAGKNISIFR